MKEIPVVFYHSVGRRKPEWLKNYLTTGYAEFEDHLRYISENYTTIHLKEYRAIRHGVAGKIKNPLVITFDDGYLDNWQYAWPLMRRYGLKGTIFVNPEFVDERKVVRPGMESAVSAGNGPDLPQQWGFLSWEEMRIMEESGVMDIQSHTMSHTKYTVSDRLIGFHRFVTGDSSGYHRPGSDNYHLVWNRFPSLKPGYIEEPQAERLLPPGYPIFESRPALMARQVEINQGFIDYCVEAARDFKFDEYSSEKMFDRVRPEYEKYRGSGTLIVRSESEDEYERRVREEIVGSKRIIETNLNKTVEFLCWPYGENNETLHQMALEAGYLMTTTGKSPGVAKDDLTRIPVRMGMDFSSTAKRMKTKFKLRAFSGKSPYSELLTLFRYGRSGSY